MTGRGLGRCGGRRQRLRGQTGDDSGAGQRLRRRRRRGDRRASAGSDPSDPGNEIAALRDRVEQLERQLARRRDPEAAD